MSLATIESAQAQGQNGPVGAGRGNQSMGRRAWRELAAAAMMAVLIAVPAALASASEFTFEDFTLDSSEDLLDVCTVEPTHASHFESMAFCYGFFQGAIHYHGSLTRGPNYAPIICNTEPVSVRQVVSVFVTYAQANPQHLAEPAMDTAIRALAEQWPCS
jgi:hypothetical protein